MTGTEEQSFEQAMQRLEAINKILESSDAKIEQMIELYREATVLLSYCKTTLNTIEGEFQKMESEESEG